MTKNWAAFPTFDVTPDIELTRVHSEARHPAFFNPSNAWRFGPPASRKDKFGVCYLGLVRPLSAYVEKYGRFGIITPSQRQTDALSTLHVSRALTVADLTNRKVVGGYGVTAAHSVGTDYHPSQRLASELFDAGFAGIRYRIRHDPEMRLEAIAMFGVPGEHPDRFDVPKTENPIPDWLINDGREFDINMAAPGILP